MYEGLQTLLVTNGSFFVINFQHSSLVVQTVSANFSFVSRGSRQAYKKNRGARCTSTSLLAEPTDNTFRGPGRRLPATFYQTTSGLKKIPTFTYIPWTWALILGSGSGSATLFLESGSFIAPCSSFFLWNFKLFTATHNLEDITSRSNII